MPLIVQKGTAAKQPYKFQEFPKYVYNASAPAGVLVKSAAELKALPGEWFDKPVSPDAEHTQVALTAAAAPSGDVLAEALKQQAEKFDAAFSKQNDELFAAHQKIAELTKANSDLVDALALANKPAGKEKGK